jgi:hypothetical protein
LESSLLIDINDPINDNEIFNKFIQEVNIQTNYNNDGVINAIPIITYHEIDPSRLVLFDAEMKYLYDNGFKVITMADLGYDENSEDLYITGMS